MNCSEFIIKKLPICLLSAFVFLTACGDDGSGTEAPDLEKVEGEEAEVYASLDDLPACVSSRVGDLAEVSGSYYTCSSKKWEKIVEVAKGVCNVRPCDKAVEGKWVYVFSERTAYQCKSGSWKDAEGDSFDELKFVKCFMSELVQDSVSSAEDLKSCTEKREGNISVVGKNLVACFSKKWVDIPGAAISEADLPVCKNDGYIYVLGKMAVYQCKDGTWYGDGEAIALNGPTSSSAKSAGSSSSGKQSDSSVRSSSSAKAVVDDGTKVRGVCLASKKKASKGEEVTYSFYNMGGTVVSYSWTFDKGASVASSGEAGPVVSYSRGGTHRARLVMNKGLKSESDEIVCQGVYVPGTEIAGCECNANESALTIRGGRSENAAWVVSGCTGGEPFTYDWEDGVVADGASASKVVTEAGSVSPSVTVFNDDEESLTVTCPAVSVSRSLSATCDFTVYYGNSGHLQISDVTNPPAGQEQLAFTLVGSEESEPKTVPIEGSCWDSNCSFWGTVMTMNYVSPRYDVIFDGDTICTYIAVTDCSCEEVELVSGSKELTESNPVQYRWTVSGCQDHGAGALTYSWIGDNYEADEEDPKIAVGSFTERGRYYARVKVTNPLGYSMTATCARASVTEAPYVEKDLEYGDVLTAGSYAIYSHEGGRSWLTWAEDGEEIPEDLEDWFDQGFTSIATGEKECGGKTYQAYTINVSYPVLLTVPEGKSLTLHQCVEEEEDDE